MTTPQELFEHELQDIYYAEQSLTKAIPQGMACTLEIAEYLKKRLR